jgi:hypothetical protein
MAAVLSPLLSIMMFQKQRVDQQHIATNAARDATDTSMRAAPGVRRVESLAQRELRLYDRSIAITNTFKGEG